MPYKKISGIYQIKNLKNNKVYVGSATNLKNRLVTHKRLLLANKHFNTHLQSSFNKNGAEAFEFKIIELCTVECLLDREDYWIAKFFATNKQFGYNKRLKAENNSGIKFSDETKKKLSKAHLGHKRSNEANKKIIKSQYKKVCQYDLNGCFIRNYESVLEASLICNLQKTGISMCCRDIIKQSGGFIWSYKLETKIKCRKIKKQKEKHYSLIITICDNIIKTFLTTNEVAAYYEISRSLVYKLLLDCNKISNCKKGKLNIKYEL